MLSITAGTKDAYCRSALLGTGFVNVRNHAGSVVDADDSSTAQAVGCIFFRGRQGLGRSYFDFNTASVKIPPSHGTLRIYGYSTNNADLIVVKSEQSSPVVASDFKDAFPADAETAIGLSNGSGAGTLANIDDLTYSTEVETWSTSDWNDIQLNSTALGDMASLDTFKLCLMEYDSDYLDIDFGSSGVTAGFYWAESGNQPYIEYQPADKTFLGVNF